MLCELCELPVLTPAPSTSANKGHNTWNIASSCSRGKESSLALQTSTLELCLFLLTSLTKANHIIMPHYSVLFHTMPSSHRVAGVPLTIAELCNQLAIYQ